MQGVVSFIYAGLLIVLVPFGIVLGRGIMYSLPKFVVL